MLSKFTDLWDVDRWDVNVWDADLVGLFIEAVTEVEREGFRDL